MHPTSHYVDPKKKTDIKKGRAIIMKVKGADGYSTVYKQARKKIFTVSRLEKILRNMKKQAN